MQTAPANPYLRASSGALVGSRGPAAVFTFGGLLTGPAVGGALVLAAVVLDRSQLALAGVLGGFGLWVVLLIPLLVSIFVLRANVQRATAAYWAGDRASATRLCHGALRWIFRTDVRLRAFHVLGLCAEADGDFVAAADLFERASRSIPSLAAPRWRRQTEAIVLSHLALALAAVGEVARADVAVQAASRTFALGFAAPGAGGAFDSPLFQLAPPFREIEGPRDPRALLGMASALVLLARGAVKEAVDLIDRERYFLGCGLPLRERALVQAVEDEARARLTPGALRRAPVAEVDPWVAHALGRRS